VKVTLGYSLNWIAYPIEEITRSSYRCPSAYTVHHALAMAETRLNKLYQELEKVSA
jgi:hypothetical protein